MNQFCEMKGILRQYSVARTPQQNRVVEKRNRTLIEAVRTMLAANLMVSLMKVSLVDTLSIVKPLEYSIVEQGIVEENLHIRIKLERRLYLSKIPLWPANHILPRSIGVLKMMDQNLQVMMERRLMKIQEKIVNSIDQEKENNVNITDNVNAAKHIDAFVVGGKKALNYPFGSKYAFFGIL
ncbi:putative ribonuclease H-like domain-containing protein [Tanacetum coccineum]